MPKECQIPTIRPDYAEAAVAELSRLAAALKKSPANFALAGGILAQHRDDLPQQTALALPKNMFSIGRYLMQGMRGSVETLNLESFLQAYTQGRETTISIPESQRERGLEILKGQVRGQLRGIFRRIFVYPVVGIVADFTTPYTLGGLETSTGITLALSELKNLQRALRLLFDQQLKTISFEGDTNLDNFQNELEQEGEEAAVQSLDDADNFPNNGRFLKRYVGLADFLQADNQTTLSNRAKNIIKIIHTKLIDILNPKLPSASLVVDAPT